MYCLRTNKDLKGKRKTIKFIASFVIAILFITGISFASSEYLKNYRRIRGTTNPAEIMTDLSMADATAAMRQMALTLHLGVFEKDAQNRILPAQPMTNMDTARAMINLFKPEIAATNPQEGEIRDQAIQMGFITEEELKLEKNANFFERQTTARELAKFLSKQVNIDLKYQNQPNNTITRLDFAQMVYDNKESILPKRGIQILSGEGIYGGSIKEDNKNKAVITVKLDRVYHLPEVTLKNQVHKIDDEIEKAADVSYVNVVSGGDVVILTPRGFTNNSSALELGNKMNIYFKDGQIQYLEQFSIPRSSATGVLKDWNIGENTDNVPPTENLTEDPNTNIENRNFKSTIEIVSFDGQIQKYIVHPSVKLLKVNAELGTSGVEKPIDVGQLVFGQEVSIETVGGIVTVIRTYVSVPEELNAYIPPMSRLVSGAVLDFSKDHITLTDSSTYNIGPDTMILKNSTLSDYRSIKDGDLVKLYFDDIKSPVISKLEIEGSQRQADKIIRGKVGPYSIAKKGLTIKNVEQLVDGSWVPVENLESNQVSNPAKYPQLAHSPLANNQLPDATKKYENYKIAGDIFAKSQKLNPNQLKYYVNQDIFAVLSGNSGIPTIAKAKIRQGSGYNYQDDINNIDHSVRSFQAQGNQITFDDSTIIVKDGNLIATGNLEENIQTNVETDLMKNAQLIVQNGSAHNVSKTESFPYKIYRGTIRDVFENSILLGNDIENGRKVNHYFMLKGGVWTRMSESKTTPRLRFTESTAIYDYDNNKTVTSNQLKEMQYAFNAFGTRPPYFDRQVYAITKDDLLVALVFLSNDGYVQVNSQNMITAFAAGPYNAPGANAQEGQENPIKPIVIRNISSYNTMKGTLEPIKPIITTDTAEQRTVQTPVRKILNINKATLIDNGQVIPKTSAAQLSEKYITVIYKQDKSRQMDRQGDMEMLDAIAVISF